MGLWFPPPIQKHASRYCKKINLVKNTPIRLILGSFDTVCLWGNWKCKHGLCILVLHPHFRPMIPPQPKKYKEHRSHSHCGIRDSSEMSLTGNDSFHGILLWYLSLYQQSGPLTLRQTDITIPGQHCWEEMAKAFLFSQFLKCVIENKMPYFIFFCTTGLAGLLHVTYFQFQWNC